MEDYYCKKGTTTNISGRTHEQGKEKAQILLATISLHIIYAILKLKAHHFIRVNYYTIACWPTT